MKEQKRANTKGNKSTTVVEKCGNSVAEPLKKDGKNFNGAAPHCSSGAKISMKEKSKLMTMFQRDFEKIIAPERLTIETINSEMYKTLRAAYVLLFTPLVAEREGGAK